MKNKSKSDKYNPENINYYDITSTVSSSECTGMIPTPPQNEDELESYQDMFGMEIAKNNR